MVAMTLAQQAPPYTLDWYPQLTRQLQHFKLKRKLAALQKSPLFRVERQPGTNTATITLLPHLVTMQLADACMRLPTADERQRLVQAVAMKLAAQQPPYALDWGGQLSEHVAHFKVKRSLAALKGSPFFKVTVNQKPSKTEVRLLPDIVLLKTALLSQEGAGNTAVLTEPISPANFVTATAPVQESTHTSTAQLIHSSQDSITSSSTSASASATRKLFGNPEVQSTSKNDTQLPSWKKLYQLSFDDLGRAVYTQLPEEDAQAITMTHTQPASQHVASSHPSIGLPAEEASVLALLPASVQEYIHSQARQWPAGRVLMDVVLDVGKPPILRFQDHTTERLPDTVQVDLQQAVDKLVAAHTRMEVEDVSAVPIGDEVSVSSTYHLPTAGTLTPAYAPPGLFGPDNRLGVPGTLHRISAMRTRDGGISGLTYRIGRHLPGAAGAITDVLTRLAQGMHVKPWSQQPITGTSTPTEDSDSDVAVQRCSSILVVGRPGRGKTTLLRDMARMLADDLRLTVVVVDSSLEIGGSATVPHPALGSARRMEVPVREEQQDVLIKAVQNHTPQAVVVDEIGSAKEVTAVRTIIERGIAMLGTAHGVNLASLTKNATLMPLIGGIASQTVGDDMARRAGGVKSRRERLGPSAFSTLVEVLDMSTYRVHHDVEESVDRLLLAERASRAARATGGQDEEDKVLLHTEIRHRRPDGSIWVTFETFEAAERAGVV